MSEITNDTSTAVGGDGQVGDKDRMTVDLNVLDHLGINLHSNIAAVDQLHGLSRYGGDEFMDAFFKKYNIGSRREPTEQL